jgi:hypothetical protein
VSKTLSARPDGWRLRHAPEPGIWQRVIHPTMIDSGGVFAERYDPVYQGHAFTHVHSPTVTSFPGPDIFLFCCKKRCSFTHFFQERSDRLHIGPKRRQDWGDQDASSPAPLILHGQDLKKARIRELSYYYRLEKQYVFRFQEFSLMRSFVPSCSILPDMYLLQIRLFKMLFPAGAESCAICGLFS